MKNNIFADFLAFAAVLFSTVGAAHAEGVVSLDSDVKVERSVDKDGVKTTVLSEPNDVIPGDRLVFSTEYNNQGADAVDNFVVTNPLPGAVKLAELDPSFLVSVDGGKNYAPLSDLTVDVDIVGNRPAELADVTHIRWVLKRLDPGARGTLSYQAIVR